MSASPHFDDAFAHLILRPVRDLEESVKALKQSVAWIQETTKPLLGEDPVFGSEETTKEESPPYPTGVMERISYLAAVVSNLSASLSETCMNLQIPEKQEA
jgi:hypothetical protein